MKTRTSPTFEEFVAATRRELRFLETEFGFRESAERKKYSNPFQVRFESQTTLVIVEGVGHGSSACIGVGDRSKQRVDFDITVPVWTFATMARKEGAVTTGSQLEDIPLQATILREDAADVLRGDLSRLSAAERLVDERIAYLRNEEAKRG